MSVKLVIVALLVAAATTRAQRMATVKVCPVDDTKCECKATADNILNFTVGKCELKEDFYWMVDSCEDGHDIIAKGVKDSNCDPATWTVSTTECAPIAYHQATCSGDKTKVTLIAGCASNACTAETGGCSAAVEFTFGADPQPCTEVGKKFYKLQSENCDADTISFAEFSDSFCTQDKLTLAVPQTCGASHYRKGACIIDAAPGSKPDAASFKVCSTSDCNTACNSAVEFEMNVTRWYDGKYLLIETCKDNEALNYKVYDKWTKYGHVCSRHQNSNAMVTCSDISTTTTETSTTSEASSNSSDSSDSSNSSNSSDSSDNSNSSDSSDNSNSSDSSDNSNSSNTTEPSNITSLAPAHSVGVLALVLCLLVCAY